MTDEEENRRKEKIYMIASHFSNIDFEDLIENPKHTLDDTWPYILEKFITPKLLDMAPTDFWTAFGHCYFCAHWKGYKKIHFKLLKKSKKVIPFSGTCRVRKANRDKRRNLITESFNCCGLWLPERLYQQIYMVRIERFLKDGLYKYEDYVYDLHNINIWDYFFDKYSVSEEGY